MSVWTICKYLFHHKNKQNSKALYLEKQIFGKKISLLIAQGKLLLKIKTILSMNKELNSFFKNYFLNTPKHPSKL
jgi:hypothetical protein